MKLHRLIIVVAIALTLGLGTGSAWAEIIEFEGITTVQASNPGGAGKGVHLHSQGRVNFQWVPIVGQTSDPSDPALGASLGMLDLNLFDYIGQNSINVGDAFTGLDAIIPLYVVQPGDQSNINAQDAPPSSYDFMANVHITSIAMTDDYQIDLSGYLTGMINNSASSLLSGIAAAINPVFSASIIQSSRTGMTFAQALNSGVLDGDPGLSSWANIRGSIGGGTPDTPTGGTPEPGTLVLMATGLVGGMVLRRRMAKESKEA